MKKQTFIIYGDPVCEGVVVGDMKGLLEYIKSYADELANGETMMCTIKLENSETMVRIIERRDMTEEELATSPVI